MPQVLVIQHPNLAQIALPETQKRLTFPAQLSGSVLRLAVADDFQLSPEMVAELNHVQADFAVLPDRPFSDIKLIVSDMDSTLITIECIDEIASGAGLKDKVSEITERAMRGELDFSASLRERVALLRGLPESHLQYVYDNVLNLTDGAEALLRECQAHGVKFMLVSGGFTFFTERLKQRLGLDFAYANELEVENGVLTGRVVGQIIDAQAKADLLVQHREQLGCRPDQVIAVGDGANDIPMLQQAGLGVAFHAKPKTQASADVAINHNGLDAIRGWFA